MQSLRRRIDPGEPERTATPPARTVGVICSGRQGIAVFPHIRATGRPPPAAGCLRQYYLNLRMRPGWGDTRATCASAIRIGRGDGAELACLGMFLVCGAAKGVGGEGGPRACERRFSA